jgi:serine phosphatase RsbU (regulator of sigma subunit)
MVVEAQRLPIEALAGAAEKVAAAGDLRSALAAIVAGAASATGADLVVVRVIDDFGDLIARAVAPETSPRAAEVVGTRAAPEGIAAREASAAVADLAGDVIVEAAFAGGRVVGSIEVVRQEPFGLEERALASLAAAQVGLAFRTLAPGTQSAAIFRRAMWLELAGEALAAGVDPARSAVQTVRIALESTGARAGILWRVHPNGEPELLTAAGDVDRVISEGAVLVRAALVIWHPVGVEHDSRLPPELSRVATLPLGQPVFAALQLFFGENGAPGDDELPGLTAFAARAAHALRSGARALDVETELGRTRALLDVVGEAISRLSLAHTLETAVERSAELLQVDRLAIYLREDGRLFPAAGRGVAGELDDVTALVADALQGPLRARSSVYAHVLGAEAALGPVRSALRGADQRSVVAVPLHVREEPIGLLVAYPGDREPSENDLALLTALSAPLAVAVQNARLHERATELGGALYEVLDAERKAAKQVNALYEISRSFAQTLSLDATLAAVTETLVTVLQVDAAVVRVPDERGDQFVPRSVHVAEAQLTDAVRTILSRPQPRPLRSRRITVLDPATATQLGGAHALLRPFLEKGSTAALLRIANGPELLAELTIISLDPAEPITEETLATAGTIAQQAALAIDNARLYQQQKQFAETMQQSLLPREHPSVPGLAVGRVYESAAQVDVGGDVYDFLELADGRLAVVLGDVTGHGIDATADMAMAKFVFRSLAREHPEPSEFLAHANEVVVGEIAVGKFITMAYLTVDSAGTLLCASAGHPQPRVVGSDGSVEALACGGLALGIDAPQEYEQVRAELPPGASVVLYTDGVIESRQGRELFGLARLDETLAANAGRSAQEIADAVLAACRGFAGGDLPDDCAIVVIQRSA